MSSVRSDAQVGGSAQESLVAARSEALDGGAPADASAFAQIAIRFQDRIYNALRKMTGNEQDAADLTQETFAKAMEHLAGFRGDSAVYTWLFRIAVNLATTRVRQIRRRRTVQAGQLSGGEREGVLERQAAPQEMPQEALERQERERQVRAALDRLPEEQRTLLVLRDIEGVEYQQMADMLGVPLGTLKSRLFRSRLALRDELKGYFESYEVA